MIKKIWPQRNGDRDIYLFIAIVYFISMSYGVLFQFLCLAGI
jgi:hypothetical protein